MSQSLRSLIQAGTKLWLDSVDPDLVTASRQYGATGATSNPVIVADLIKSGRFDDQIERLIQDGADDTDVAWRLTDQLVQQAQDVFLPVWKESGGNDGYVSFEVDPLLEDPDTAPPHRERVDAYIRLGKQWSAGRENRMIKVPATEAGIGALEELAAAGVPLNVTLIFTPRQYQAARDAVARGIARRNQEGQQRAKSVYSIFVSRIDVYTQKHLPDLSAELQGQVGILNAKQIWRENQQFWRDRGLALDQEIVFASTGVKDPAEKPWKYVAALAGSDIQTNPPATNEQAAASGETFTAQLSSDDDAGLLAELEEKVDRAAMETVLMREGVAKFADPQKALLELIASRRAARGEQSAVAGS